MSEYRNITISDIMHNYINKTTYLPAIQREFVWKREQICKLFDSLMCGYPISSFLFWKIREEDKHKWNSYEFIRDFNKENPHNTLANLDGVNKDIYLVLDGQQRMTALYIGLRGSYRYFYYRWRKEYLFLNLMQKPNDEICPDTIRFSFEFRENDYSYDPENEFWYRVGNILDYEKSREARSAIQKSIISLPKEKQDIVENNLDDLHNIVHTVRCLNFYEENSRDYDKVVEIFVRTNTGGTKLEYSDILLSTATAQWKNLNARDEIYKFTDDLNATPPGFGFGKDFVMKGCLYLTSGLPIQYMVSSFTRENLAKIEENWEQIKTSLTQTIQLVSKFGFNNKNIVSANALLPIAYYLMQKHSSVFLNSSAKEDIIDKSNIQTWLIFNILRGAFGAASDAKLKNCQEVLNTYTGKSFPYRELNAKLLSNNEISQEEIDTWLNFQYSGRYTYLVLSLLYPDRDWQNCRFDEDHIYPKSEFSRTRLQKRGFSEQKIQEYLYSFNTILNLELLEDSENKSKNAQDFESWLSTREDNFKKRHFIPDMESYEFEHFLEFIDARKKLLSDRLKQISFAL